MSIMNDFFFVELAFALLEYVVFGFRCFDPCLGILIILWYFIKERHAA